MKEINNRFEFEVHISLIELFDGDHDKVKKLNVAVCEKMGFKNWVAVSGQTYTRKVCTEPVNEQGEIFMTASA